MSATMTISQVAGEAGVGVETIRYYQRRGLIAEPPKPANGFRRYSAETVDRLRFIKRAQELGFTLKEVLDSRLGSRAYSEFGSMNRACQRT